MAGKNQAGFTIIETVLVLAISALIIVSAFVLISGQSDSVQRRDTANQVAALYDKQLTNTIAGVVEVPITCNIPEGCVFLGYYMEGDGSNINEIAVYQMFGKRLSTSDPCLLQNPQDPLYCAEPRPIPSTPIESYTIPWSYGTSRIQGARMRYKGFGFYRSPNSSDVIPIGFRKSNGVSIDDRRNYRISEPDTQMNQEFSALHCLQLDDSESLVAVGYSEKQLQTEVYLDDEVQVWC